MTMTPKEKVMQYITPIWGLNESFDDGLRLEDFPLLPGGTKVIDMDGEVLYYFDLIKNEIVERGEDGFEMRVPWFVVSGDDPKGYYPGGLK